MEILVNILSGQSLWYEQWYERKNAFVSLLINPERYTDLM